MPPSILDGRTWADYIRTSLVPDLQAFARCLPERLLPAFGRIGNEADRVADTVWKNPPPYCDPEDFDEAAHADRAQDAGQNYYDTMNAVRQGLINLYTVGLAHLLDQMLLLIHRQALLTRDEQQNHERFKLSVMRKRLRSQTGIDVEKFTSWKRVDELRLLSNTAKHADGPACDELKRRRRDLFWHRQPGEPEMDYPVEHIAVFQPLMGSMLYVTAEAHAEYAAAAEAFLNELADALERYDTERPAG